MYQYDIYKKAPLITKNEFRFYNYLKELADRKGYILFTKVRLADIITPQSPEYSKSYQINFNKIKAKHIDFILCDKINLNILVAIEIDDSTHQRYDRIQRDNFVDHALFTAGIPIIHTYDTYGLEEKINSTLKIPMSEPININNIPSSKDTNGFYIHPKLIKILLLAIVLYGIINFLILTHTTWPPPFPLS